MKRRRFDIGKMRHRVTLYNTVREDDGYGGFDRLDASVSTEIGEYWAHIEPVSAHERIWGGQFTELTTHKCWLRYNDLLTGLDGAIMSWKGKQYYIERIYDPNNLKEFLFLVLREGGPL